MFFSKKSYRKAWKSVLELTEKNTIFAKEKEALMKKLTEESEEKDSKERRFYESKNFSEKLEKYEKNFQQISSSERAATTHDI